MIGCVAEDRALAGRNEIEAAERVRVEEENGLERQGPADPQEEIDTDGTADRRGSHGLVAEEPVEDGSDDQCQERQRTEVSERVDLGRWLSQHGACHEGGEKEGDSGHDEAAIAHDESQSQSERQSVQGGHEPVAKDRSTRPGLDDERREKETQEDVISDAGLK